MYFVKKKKRTVVCSYVVEVSKIPTDNLALLGNCYLYVNNVKLIFQGEVEGVKCELSCMFSH